uniref:Uncharacterized protein n=1 Tax=Anguilla anguilla TaxID=7936 RepID=A0A0E9QVE3_ANGAN
MGFGSREVGRNGEVQKGRMERDYVELRRLARGFYS